MRKIFSCALRKSYQQRGLYYEIWNLANGLKSWILYVRRGFVE
ncbi:Uncharacterised protein [Klebsiella pneumoniae]|nr:Uncharacterised protein [Klebsiella pneumoniae]